MRCGRSPAGAGHGGPAESASLWDSYNIARPVVSKTYAPNGTSRRPTRARPKTPFDRPVDRSKPALPEARGTYGNTRDKEHLMLDIVMLALGLGFFVAGIGYAYACERL
jgi:hypothetical protein